jgi:hypothetical protein
MEEFKESLFGIVVLFIVKVIIAIAMDVNEPEESISSEELNSMFQEIEEERNMTFEDILAEYKR